MIDLRVIIIPVSVGQTDGEDDDREEDITGVEAGHVSTDGGLSGSTCLVIESYSVWRLHSHTDIILSLLLLSYYLTSRGRLVRVDQ